MDHWVTGVGMAQRQLPINVVNEYCNPDRSFIPCPNFNELKIKRSCNGDAGDWWKGRHLNGMLGTTFAWTRANREQAGAGRPFGAVVKGGGYWGKRPVLEEVIAIKKLQEVATQKISKFRDNT